MITGSYPPDICGVGDYTSRILKTNVAKNWKLYKPDNWRLFSFRKKIREIDDYNIKHIILQYPTLGYGWSLLPHLICLYYAFVPKIELTVVFHELSQQTLKFRISAVILLICAKRLIFTTSFEKDYVVKYFPFLKWKCRVIKILSNIGKCETIAPFPERKYDLVYFGLIRPHRGIEEFFKVAVRIKTEFIGKRIVILGQVPDNYEEYFRKIEERCELYDITLYRDKPDSETAQILNDSKIAYLPYPDGASERRGTFLSALLNGCIVVATKGKFTTSSMAKAALFVEHDDALNLISELFQTDNNELIIRQNAGLEYLKEEFPDSWEDVAKKYTEALA